MRRLLTLVLLLAAGLVKLYGQPSAPVPGVPTQPTCQTPTGSVVLSGLPETGSWIINPGSIPGTGSTTTISGLGPGTYSFTVTNEALETSPASADVVINEPPIPPEAATLTITQPTCAVTTGTIVVLSPVGAYEYNIDGGVWQASTTFTGVTSGLHTLLVRSTTDNTCISPSASATIDEPPPDPAASTFDITQPTCVEPTGTINITAPTGSFEYNIDGGTWQAGVTFTGVPAGLHTILVRSIADNECVSDPVSANVESPPSIPDPPVTETVTQPTCTVSTGSVALSGLPSTGTWTLTRNPGGIISTGTGTTATVTGLSAGTYTFTVAGTSGCTSAESANVVINPQPSTPAAPIVGTITQPTCSVATGSVAISGLPSSGTWTVTGNPGGITSTGTGTVTTISGLVVGTYTFTVTNLSGCISDASGDAVINSQPATPSAPSPGITTQPTCTVATGSVVLSGLPATGTWTLTRNPGGFTSTGTGTTTTVTGLAAGTYTFTVTGTSGCTSGSSANVVINPQPATPTAPTVGTITQPTCSVVTGSVALGGLPATGTWTLTRNPGGNTSTGTGTGTTVSGLVAGTYTFTVANSSGCISPSTGNVVITSQPSTPSAPVTGTVTQPTCTVPTGSVALSGLPATGTWTLTRNPGGITSTGAGTTITVSGLAAGTYTFTVTNASGCISAASGSVVINSPPPTPAVPSVGTVTQPTCSVETGSVVLSGLPSGTWTLTRNPGGITTTGTGTSTTVSGLFEGSYTFRVTNASGCISVTTGNVVINAQPPTPAAPATGTVTPPTCTVSTGSVVLSGLPPTGIWTLTRNPGGVTSTGTGSVTTITGISAGTYTFNVTNVYGCTSDASDNVVINAQPPVPAAPSAGTVTHPTCTVATGSVVLSGLPSGTWTLTRNPGGISTAGTGPSTTISGLTAGTYSFTVTNASGCISTASVNVVINAQPPTPAAPGTGPITHPTCTIATGGVVLNGLPATGTWTLTQTPGGTSTTGTGTSATVTGLNPGTYSFTVTNAAGCTSGTSTNIVINPQPLTPTPPVTGTITQPTCFVATGGVALSGLPSTGAWTVIRSPGGESSAGSGTTTTISAIPSGTYTFTVTNASGCTSAPTGDIIINLNPTTPAAPVTGTIVDPTCTVATGSVVLNGLPATGTWTLTRIPGNAVSTGTGTSTTVPELAAGSYTFTVTNTLGCASPSSGSVQINEQPSTPAAPIAGTITQPTCTVETGSIVLNGLPSTGTWTLTGNPGNITLTGTGPATTIPGLHAGTYSFNVTNASDCTSPVSTNIVINAQPLTPAAPVVGTAIHPTCTNALGSVQLTGLPAGGPWTITSNPGGATSSGSGGATTITGIASGSYNFTVTNVSGCTSAASGNAVINAQPVTPSAPVIHTVAQPLTGPGSGSVVLNGLPQTGTWTVTVAPGGGTVTGSGTGTTIPGLDAESYTFIVTNSLGCLSQASASAILYSLRLNGISGEILSANDTISIGNSDSGSLSINVDLKADWSVSDNSLWFQAVKESASSTIRVNYMENISAADKIAPFILTYDSDKEILINIRQKARVSHLNGTKFSNVKLYPNPAGDFVFLNFGEEEFEKIVVSVTNMQGHLVLTGEYIILTPGITIGLSISGLNEGLYFVKVSDGTDQRIFQMIKY